MAELLIVVAFWCGRIVEVIVATEARSTLSHTITAGAVSCIAARRTTLALGYAVEVISTNVTGIAGIEVFPFFFGDAVTYGRIAPEPL